MVTNLVTKIQPRRGDFDNRKGRSHHFARIKIENEKLDGYLSWILDSFVAIGMLLVVIVIALCSHGNSVGLFIG